MTTVPNTRKKQWKIKYPKMRGWEILEEGLTKTEAQELEKSHAEANGCDWHGGGRGEEDDYWYVYGFNY